MVWASSLLLVSGGAVLGRVRETSRPPPRRRRAPPSQSRPGGGRGRRPQDHPQGGRRQVGRVRRRRARARHQLLYQNRRNMLEQLVGDILIENAAKAAGQTVDAFVAAGCARSACQPVTRSGDRAVLRAEQGPRAGPHARAAARRRSSSSSNRAAQAAGARAAGRGAEDEERRRRQGDARPAALHGADRRPAIRCAGSRRRR